MTDGSFKIVSNWAVLTHEVSTQRLELHSMLPKELESKNIKFFNHSISYKYELSHSSVCTFIYSKSQVPHMVSGSITNMQLYRLSEGNQTIRVRLFYQQGLDLHKWEITHVKIIHWHSTNTHTQVTRMYDRTTMLKILAIVHPSLLCLVVPVRRYAYR